MIIRDSERFNRDVEANNETKGNQIKQKKIPVYNVWYSLSAVLQVYGIRTRSRAVEIFTTCAHMICNMEELEKARV